MANGINVPLVADVAGFIRGTNDVEGALDDVTGSLDDLARDSTTSARTAERAMDGVSDALGDVSDDSRDAGRDLSRNVENGAEGAGDAADALERRFRTSLDGVAEASRTAGTAVGRDLEEGTRQASEGMGQMKDDAAANAQEVTASFDGSASSLVDGFQGAAAEMFSGFGPAGALAGMAVAAGIGLATAATEKAKEKAAEAAEGIADIATELIDLDGRERGIEQVTDALKEAISATEDGTIALVDWADAAKKAGTDPGQYMAAMAGDADALTGALAEVNAELEANATEYQRVRDLGREANAAEAESIYTLEDQKDALEDTRDALIAKKEQTDKAAEAVALYETALEEATPTLEEQTEAIIANNESLRDQANAALEASDAEISFAATLDDTTATIAENGKTLDLSTEAGRANKSALNDLASETLGLADANKVNGAATADSNAKLATGRTAFLNAADAAGMAADEANALADSYGLVPETVSTSVAVTGTTQAKADIDGVTKDRTVNVTPKADLNGWQNWADNITANLRPPTMKINPKLGQEMK